MGGIGLSTPSAPGPGSYILVPCAQDEFGGFIASLLGKPQVISRYFLNTFSIDRGDIRNFYEIVEQRVHEQQQATLIQFTVHISYSDGSSIEVPDIGSFESYAEIRPLIAVAITMTWVYLIRFMNISTPQRQQIDLVIRTNNSIRDSIDISDEIRSRIVSGRGWEFPVSPSLNSLMSLRISHTNRSWGMDIENLITGHIKNISHQNENKFVDKIRLWSSAIGFISAIATFIFLLSVGFSITAYNWQQRIELYNRISIENKDIPSILQAKVDFIVDKLTGRDSLFLLLIGIVYMVITVALSVAVGSYTSEKAGLWRPSFIVLSRTSEEHKNRLIKRYDNGLSRFCFAFFLSCISGVLGNIVFFYLWHQR